MIITPYDSFTRPANTTAYAQGDLIANSVTAASVVPLKFNITPVSMRRGCIGFVRVAKSNATATLATFKLHLFTSAPVVTNGDNGALQVASTEGWIGTVACDMATGGFAKATTGLKKRFQCLGASDLPSLLCFDAVSENFLYGLLEADAAYTPASGELFKVTLEIGDDGGLR